jgi:hypothetical protein
MKYALIFRAKELRFDAVHAVEGGIMKRGIHYVVSILFVWITVGCGGITADEIPTIDAWILKHGWYEIDTCEGNIRKHDFSANLYTQRSYAQEEFKTVTQTESGTVTKYFENGYEMTLGSNDYVCTVSSNSLNNTTDPEWIMVSCTRLIHGIVLPDLLFHAWKTQALATTNKQESCQ